MLGDDAIDPVLVQGSMVDDIERIHEMRRIAQKAFVDYNTQRSKGRVEKGRTRAVQGSSQETMSLSIGWRGPERGDMQEERLEKVRATSHNGVGPGSVVAIEGANLFVVVAGELWEGGPGAMQTGQQLRKDGDRVCSSGVSGAY